MRKPSISGLRTLGNGCSGNYSVWVGLLAFTIGLFLGPSAFAQIDVNEEIECLALTMYFEARGESDSGKVAVGYVVMNRVSDPLFPKAVCDVVRQGGAARRYNCQFSWWCDGLSDEPTDLASWRHCRWLALLIYRKLLKDPTANALWYHADYVEPSWKDAFSEGPTIGQHIFYHRAEELEAEGPAPQTAGRPQLGPQLAAHAE